MIKFSPQYHAIFLGLASLSFLAAAAPSAFAQGCVVGRECSSGIVGVDEYLKPKEFELGVNYRGFQAHDHYNGTTENYWRLINKNYVVNRQNIWDVTGTWGVNKQLSAYIDVPYINSGWSIPYPPGATSGPITGASTTPGARQQENGQGIGDIAIGVQYWLMNTVTHPNSNVQLGLGIQPPTGNDDTKSTFYGHYIANDQSIQPGDGGWDIPSSIEGFKVVRKLTFFGVGNYLVTPRDANGVPTLGTSLGSAPNKLAPSTAYNSVPDQYLVRLGVATGLTQIPGLAVSLAWRTEGVPVHDIIGGSKGFRRAGYSRSIEPGLTYTRGSRTLTIDMPITFFRDRSPTDPDGTYVSGDATFATSQLIVNYTQRFNGH